MPPTPPSSAAPALDQPERLAALRRTALLDSPAEESFDRLTRLASRLLRAPVALVTLVDEDRQFFKSCLGLPEPWASARQTPLSHSFCQHAVRTGEALVIEDAREHPLVRDNLAIRDLAVVAYLGIPLVTGDGHVLGSFCVIDGVPRRWTADEVALVRDLTGSVLTEIELRMEIAERRLAEEALRELAARNARLYHEAAEARTAAEAATRLRDEVLAVVAHDLRNPLQGIVMNAGFLRHVQSADPAARARRVAAIELASQRMDRLVRDLLDVGRIAGGGLTVRQQPIAVAPLLEGAAEIFQARAAEAGLQLAWEVGAGVEAVLADQGRVLQVLSNLLDNAIRHTPAPGRVTMRAAADGPAVRFVVEDTGEGIDPEDQPRIFDRFWQARTARCGAGLGLAIVRGVVEAHGGSVRVESRPGEGSAFSFTLPAAVRASAPAEALAHAENARG